MRDLQIKMRPTAALVPYARNPRTHSPEQVALIARSITEFGWTNPVLLDGADGVIAGHGRLLAAAELGLDEVPCIALDDLTESQRRAYVIADNKLAEQAGWDANLLKLELGELKGVEFDLSLTGFGDLELERLDPVLIGGASPDDAAEDVPEPPVDPTTRPGDLWTLGDHRLLCGDATSAEDVARLLDGAAPHLMVTDPPYGVEYDPDWRNRADRANGKPYGASAVGQVANDERVDWREAWARFHGDVAYVWHAGRHASAVQTSLETCGFEIRAQLIWAKSGMIIGRGHYHWQHEPCWYAVRKGGQGHWVGDRSQTTLWMIDHRKSETGHGTQKPIECMRRPILNNSQPGDAVYDPFLGSGTTLIAAEMTKRRCFGLEIEPAYCDVIVQRWENYTGKKAKRKRRSAA